MNCGDVKPGIPVIVNDAVTKPDSTKGMMIAYKHLSARKVGAVGIVTSYVPGHGGDVWFVQHIEDGEVGAYCFTELDHYEPGKAKPGAKRVVEL